jgi:hypothetical protein
LIFRLKRAASQISKVKETYESQITVLKQPVSSHVEEHREKTQIKIKLLHDFNKQKKEELKQRKGYLTSVLANPNFQDLVMEKKQVLSVDTDI